MKTSSISVRTTILVMSLVLMICWAVDDSKYKIHNDVDDLDHKLENDFISSTQYQKRHLRQGQRLKHHNSFNANVKQQSYFEKYKNESFPIVASITLDEKHDGHAIRTKIHSNLDVIRSNEKNKVNFIVHGYKELLATEAMFARNDNLPMNVNDEETKKLQILPQPRSLSKSSYFGSNGVPDYPTISSYSFNCYRNVEGTYMTMDHLESTFPTLAEVVSIGDSYLKSVGQGGHDMKVLKLTNKEKEVEKSPMFLICAVHSREIATAEACARFSEYMLGNYEVNADVTWILDFVEIHIIMQANPDGREDDEKNLYYRRKNMNPNGNIGSCSSSGFGNDLNRNFPHSEWGTSGVSPDYCSDTFPGIFAGSEKETQNIVQYVESVLPPGTNQKDPDTGAYLSDSKGVFIDCHSYWQAIFWPWAYNEYVDAPNDVDLAAFAKKMASFSSPVYAADNEVYPTSGDTTDWAHESVGAASFTVEIGTEFYQDCDSSEDFIFENARRMFLYGARVSMAPYELPKGPDITSLKCSCTNSTDSSMLQVSVTASDSERALAFQTGSDKISSIKLYMDNHPSESSSNFVETTFGSASSSTEDAVLNYPLSNLEAGKHILYVQASDDKETKGPVSATYFTLSSSGSCECDGISSGGGGGGGGGGDDYDDFFCPDCDDDSLAKKQYNRERSLSVRSILSSFLKKL